MYMWHWHDTIIGFWIVVVRKLKMYNNYYLSCSMWYIHKITETVASFPKDLSFTLYYKVESITSKWDSFWNGYERTWKRKDVHSRVTKFILRRRKCGKWTMSMDRWMNVMMMIFFWRSKVSDRHVMTILNDTTLNVSTRTGRILFKPMVRPENW